MIDMLHTGYLFKGGQGGRYVLCIQVQKKAGGIIFLFLSLEIG